MPIYEYKCLDCSNHFEVMQKVTDEPLKICEKCQGKLEKQWSLSGFQFKGTGWYVTDYTGRGKSETKTGETSEKNSAGKSESTNGSGEKSSSGESTAQSETASKPKADSTPKSE
jgi:putative FmdB family regulatory protein